MSELPANLEFLEFDDYCTRCGTAMQATHHPCCHTEDGTPLYIELSPPQWRRTFLSPEQRREIQQLALDVSHRVLH